MSEQPSIQQLPTVSPEALAEIDFSPPVEWDEPEPIHPGALLAVEPFIEALAPGPFQDYIQDVSVRMSSPADGICMALTVAVGAIIGTRCGIKPKRADDWLVVPNLFGAYIAPPGRKKTAALKAATRFLDALEAEAELKYSEAERQYKAEYAEYKALEAGIEADMKSAARPQKSRYGGDGKNAVNHDMEALKARHANLQEPPKPVRTRWQTNNATVEKLHELCKENPRGVLLMRDELAGWLAQLDQAGHEQDRAFYLEGWNGTGRFDYDRIGRGTVSAKTVCLSVLGGIQPDKLREYLK